MTDETKQTLKETFEITVERAEATVRLPFVRSLSRFGFYTKGVLFIVIGILAIAVAIGLRGGKLADPTGALGVVAQKPFGKILLILFVVGAIGHGLWNILRGAADIDDAGNKVFGIIQRSISIGVGIFYVGLALTALSILLTVNASDANGELPKTIVAILLVVPLFGVILVFLIGLGLIGAGFHECYSGISGKYQENYRAWAIKGWHGIFITVLGVLSFTARAIILVLMGWFFIAAAIDYNPNEAIGIDGALRTLAHSAYGEIILFVIAVGLICHGILAFYEAKYRRIC